MFDVAPLQVLMLNLDAQAAVTTSILGELTRAGLKVNCRFVSTEAEFAADINPFIDLILADCQFVPRALLLLQECNFDIPLIDITEWANEGAALECMRLGASDYLCSDRLARLGLAVQQALQARRSRVAQRQMTERFNTVFQASPVAISLATLHEGLILDINDAFVGMFGYPRDELVGHTSIELQLWESHDERRNMIIGLRNEGRVHGASSRFRTKSGEIRHALYSAERIILDNQECVHV